MPFFDGTVSPLRRRSDFDRKNLTFFTYSQSLIAITIAALWPQVVTRFVTITGNICRSLHVLFHLHTRSITSSIFDKNPPKSLSPLPCVGMDLSFRRYHLVFDAILKGACILYLLPGIRMVWDLFLVIRSCPVLRNTYFHYPLGWFSTYYHDKYWETQHVWLHPISLWFLCWIGGNL